MSKATRILLIIAGIAVILGIFLTFTGFMLGAKYRVNYTRNGFKVMDDVKQLSESLDLEAFHNMDLDISFADLELIESDKFYIEYTYFEDEGKPEISVENDLLKVKSPERNQNIFNWGIGFNVNKVINHMKIYFPAGTEFIKADIGNEFGKTNIDKITANEFIADLSFGDLDLGNIQSKTMDISLEYGAGKLINGTADSIIYTQGFGDGLLKDITTGDLKIKMEYGNLDLQSMSAENADIINKFGRVEGDDIITKGMKLNTEYSDTDISGEFYGATDIHASFGNVDLKSDLDESQYNYILSAEFGKVTLNNEKYKNNITIDNKAENSITADVTNGNVSVRLK
jgi:hypothetical protein